MAATLFPLEQCHSPLPPAPALASPATASIPPGSAPAAAYQRLRAFIAERMRMSHVVQPLMLMELLGRRSPAPASDIARIEKGSYALVGSDELTDAERDQLLALWPPAPQCIPPVAR